MKTIRTLFATLILLMLGLASSVKPQGIQLKNAKTWQLSGRAQLQYLYNTDIEGSADRTNNGFRIRRGRFQVKGKLNQYVETKFQIEVRDNSPKLKDAEGKLKLANQFYVRFGQFKVPVWREELRSSSKLLLIERSVAAEFLADFNLSARQIGIELGRKTHNGLQFTVNFSNGAGEGGREDAGRGKKGLFINNGKLLTARLNMPATPHLQLGLSGALNRAGQKSPTEDNTGTISVIAPDFGLYLKLNSNQRLDIEGGLAVGRISKAVLLSFDDQNFTLFEVTGRWMKQLARPNAELAGLDAVEFAAGYSLVDENVTLSVFRFGPAVYFGKQTRIQLNAEIENNIGSEFKIRSQATFNF